MRKDLLITISLLFLLNSGVFSQEVIPISNEGLYQIDDCTASLLITDSNAENGNYAAGEDFSLTVCLNESLTGPLVALISPEMYGHVWDVDANAILAVYDGIDTGGELIGTFNSILFPEGMAMTAPGQCLTLQFTSFESGTGAGFEMDVLCGSTFENQQPFFLQLTTTPPLQWDESIGEHVVNVCQGEIMTSALSLDFPFAGMHYPQSTESTMIKWAFGGQATYRGMGLTSISHVAEKESGTRVIVDLTDSIGYNFQYVFYVRTSAAPDFTVALPSETSICVDQPVDIVGGMENGEVTGASPKANGFQLHAFYGQELFLPDGNDNNYTTDIMVSGFDENQVLSESDILQSLCVNMEHSFLGDLEMMFTCPNGTSVNIFNAYSGLGLFQPGFGGAGTFLGDANDFGPGPGFGFDYCFGLDAEWGTLGDEYAAGNTIPVTGFPPGGNAMSPGLYLPEESYTAFVGCPLNGLWTLTVRDNLFIDDGYIFDWGIVFDIQSNPDSLMYESPLVDAVWEANAMILENNGSSVTIFPTEDALDNLVFRTTDFYGCNFTDTLEIGLIPPPDMMAPVETCGLIYEFGEQFSDGTWELLSTTSGSTEINFSEGPQGVVSLEVEQPGEYLLNYTEPQCGYDLEVLVTFLEEFNPDCVLSTRNTLENKQIVLSPNPARDVLHIDFALSRNALVEVAIVSMDGRIVKNEKMQGATGNQQLQIDISGLGEGIYLVRFSTETGAISKPLIIVR